MLVKGLFFILLQCIITPLFAHTADVRLPNPELSLIQKAERLGPFNQENRLSFTLWLKLRNQTQLDQIVKTIYDPQSPAFQQFLNADEVKRDYLPDENMIRAVTSYFKHQGMQVEPLYSNLKITGTAGQIEQIFHIKLNNYRYRNKIFYGNDQAPLIPQKIAAHVAGVSGLSNIPYASPKRRFKPKDVNIDTTHWQPEEIKLLWDSFTPAALPTTTSLQGVSGSHLRTVYQLNQIPPVNGVAIDGANQTIVIIDGCGNSTPNQILNHVNHYNTENSLPQLNASNFAVVKPDGSPYTGPCANPNGWDGEIILDIDASHTIAPAANIVLVMTDDVNNAEVAHALTTITSNQFSIGGFSNAYVVSNSWDNDVEHPFEMLEAILQLSAAQGLSVNFAAGDCGDQTYASSWPCTIMGAEPSVQYPVSSAFVTAVSGTSLFVDQFWNYAFETGWGTRVNGSFYSGSMGGVSRYRSAPAWQSVISNFIVGGYPQGTNNKRALPDIAMLGDLYTGLLTYSDGCNPCWDGGASLATPLFSGTVTLVNQARAALAGGAHPLGLAAPYFYVYNASLLQNKAINLITPPHLVISGATPINGGPVSAFKLHDPYFNQEIGFNWDSSLTIVENQFWNDVVGVGSPNIPNFVQMMARM
ncbi:protease pro-enzyme activation domain-containing protein [Legionella genomosp. 1]|uniref:S53 family peptidase n=1 Tax=Legionella genomosp. 1 TaxID=1093625 RepID=UPI001055DDA9|nr:S53 family peptidase [Legionella genomosp. 1]